MSHEPLLASRDGLVEAVRELARLAIEVKAEMNVIDESVRDDETRSRFASRSINWGKRSELRRSHQRASDSEISEFYFSNNALKTSCCDFVSRIIV